MPAWWAATPGLEAGDPRVVAQHLEVGVVEVLEVRVGDAPQRDPIGGVREPDPARQALLDGLVATGAGEHEHDRGQHLLVGEPLHDLGTPRLVEPGPPSSTRAGGSAALETGHHRIGPKLARILHERGQEMQCVGASFTDEVQVHELDGAPFLDDRFGLAAHRLHPRRDLLGVRDGRRQRDDRDLGRQVDDHLFPHRAAGRVLEVVHLVEDRVAQALEGRRTGVDHVAQHFGRHDHDRRVAVDRVVAGEQADVGRAVDAHEVAVLLIRQRLQRRRVEGLAARLERRRDRVLGDERLARSGGRRDEHRPSGVERVEGAALERIERERMLRFEAGAQPFVGGHGLVVVGCPWSVSCCSTSRRLRRLRRWCWWPVARCPSLVGWRASAWSSA